MTLPTWAVETAAETRQTRGRGVLARGIGLNTLAALFQVLGSLISTILLSRLLLPEDFGVYGMVAPLAGVLTSIADGGTLYVTLRNPQIEQRTLSTLFWYAAVAGLGLAVLFALSGPALAWAFDEPKLGNAALVAALAVLLSGLSAQHCALILRCFRNDLRAVAIIGGVVAGVGLALILAWAGFGHWALIGLIVGRVGTNSVLYAALAWWRPQAPRWDRPLLGQVWRLGGPEMSTRILLLGMRESDKLVAGLMTTTAATGIYTLAQMLAVMPLAQLSSPLASLFVPYLAQGRADPGALGRRFLRLMAGFVYAVWGYACFGALFAAPLIDLVLGTRMAEVAPLFAILLPGAALAITSSFTLSAFQAVDRPDISQRLSLASAGGFAICFGLAATVGGTQAIALATLAANAAALVLSCRALARHFALPRVAWASALAMPAALAAGTAGSVWALATVLGPSGLTGRLWADTLIYAAGFMVLHAGLGLARFRGDLARRGGPA